MRAHSDVATKTAVELRGVTKRYGEGGGAVTAVDNATVTIASGAMVCIMGRSGSGKSTLLRQMGLLDTPTSGVVEIDGVDTSTMSERTQSQLRLERLGYVFQEYALLPELTAAENVYLPALMAGSSKKECRARADELLGMVALGDRATHRPQEMSGGQQQRVAIARALVNRPGIMFADEPTGNLDTAATEIVMTTMVEINRDLGVTIVFVSHDPGHREYASELVFMLDGRITDPTS